MIVCSWKANEPPHDKTNKMSVSPAKTQISLGIHPVWSIFAGRTSFCWFCLLQSVLYPINSSEPRHDKTNILLVLSRGGSNKYKPFIIGELTNINPLMVEIVSPRVFLVVRTEEVATAPLVVVRTFVEEKLHNGRVLNDNCHMQSIFSCKYM